MWRDAAVPAAHLIAAAHAGGTLLVAYDSDGAIGCCYGFVGLDDGSLAPPGWPVAGQGAGEDAWPHSPEPILWSHMLAVVPRARRRGIGVRLKQAQAAHARRLGLRRVLWTFDPLEGRNARLNLSRLGAVAGRYDVDRYGPLDDALNAGLPTDRLVADWWVGPDGARPWPRPPDRPPSDVVDLAGVSDPDAAVAAWREGSQPVAIEVPLGSWRADPAAARDARARVRAAFSAAFAGDLLAVDVTTVGERARYVLVDRRLPGAPPP